MAESLYYLVLKATHLSLEERRLGEICRKHGELVGLDYRSRAEEAMRYELGLFFRIQNLFLSSVTFKQGLS